MTREMERAAIRTRVIAVAQTNRATQFHADGFVRTPDGLNVKLRRTRCVFSDPARVACGAAAARLLEFARAGVGSCRSVAYRGEKRVGGRRP